MVIQSAEGEIVRKIEEMKREKVRKREIALKDQIGKDGESENTAKNQLQRK